ncbi:hypothetical protein ES703_71255 [subsurface metagenome]
MKCLKCQHVNRTGAKFCEECGAKLFAVCPDCGHEVIPGNQFCDACNAQLPSSEIEYETFEKLLSYMPQSLIDKIIASGKEREGERKNVSIMFADISGFTSMSERLDPEEVTDIINKYFEKISEIIYRYEGTIDRYIGDCILALFGVPIIHEDDPERSVRTALEIMDSLKELDKSINESLQMHIGINAGLVVAGKIGSDMRMQYTVIGDSVNLASRIQSVAKSGQILVGESIYKMTKSVFDYAEKEQLDRQRSSCGAHVGSVGYNSHHWEIRRADPQSMEYTP